MRDAPRLRRATRAIAAALAMVAGSLVVLAQAAALVESGSPSGPAGAAFEVDDDDSGSALFNATGLAPGQAESNCISVAHRTVSGSDAMQLRLFADATGALASDLRLVVEAGTGAAYGDCSTFDGTPVYTGTLDGFAASHHDITTGLAVDAPGDAGQVAFRFTAMVLDTAVQGGVADATFTWTGASAGAGPTTSAPPGGTPAPAPAPTAEATAPAAAPPATAAETATTGTGSPHVSVTSELPTVAPRAASPTAVDPDGSSLATEALSTEVSTPSLPELGAPDAAQSTGTSRATNPARRGSARNNGTSLVPVHEPENVVHRIRSVALTVAKKGSFPGVLILVLFAFLFVQDFIDRRDPKLALAPVHAEPDVVFAPPNSRLREA